MGENSARAFFYLLKEEVAKTYRSKNPFLTKNIHDWTGNEIRNFQDDLSNELNERVSERWFYTHLKPTENEKLPRIDMLNILSRYAGYEGWDDFRAKNEEKVGVEKEESAEKKVKKWWWIIAVLIITIGATLALMTSHSPSRYTFCFADNDTGVPLTDTIVEVTVLSEQESPQVLKSENGCFEIKTENELLRFLVKAPYYKTDTIVRTLSAEDTKETIKLRKDDYALMILLFATSDIQDWEKRRAQLDNMIDDDAVIFQINNDNTGMEMYNKMDFIDKLTTPLRSLGDIEIIETTYLEDKIINLRFIQK